MPEAIQDRLQRLQAELERARSARYSAEGRLEQLRQVEARLRAEMQAEGVSPETIAGEISRLQREVGRLLDQAEKLLAGELSPKDVELPEEPVPAKPDRAKGPMPGQPTPVSLFDDVGGGSEDELVPVPDDEAMAGISDDDDLMPDLDDLMEDEADEAPF
ncbi:hypothetical protein [Thermaerobacter litoralis]